MVSGQEFLAHGRRPPGHVLTQARMKLQALSVPSRPPTPSQGASLVTPSNPDHLPKSCQYQTPRAGLQPVHEEGHRHAASDSPPETAWDH